ncbi:MAG: hypothetical protein FJ303_01140 [Planctomycetes bacterium]|nr:hypothetical protein [Planctomycetota bacterium]
MRNVLWIVVLTLSALPVSAQEPAVKVQEFADHIQIDTDALQARIRKTGYVSGIEAGSFVDKKTGSRDAGFGLHIMDFLLGPGYKDGDEYGRDKKYHGDLPKHYIEGPQICTQAKKLEPEIVRGDGFVAVRMKYRFTKGHNGYKAGSLWEQTLVFLPKVRYIVCSETITSANDVDNLLYRIDMPGHVKHKGGDTFEQIYLSYHGMIPAKDFARDFAPDERFLYQRKDDQLPQRMIRAYQLKRNGKVGPWIAGMTLDPGTTVEAWCHQRGYVCFIQELHGRKVKAGETFGAAYLVGYFDDVASMGREYDRYKGSRRIEISAKTWTLK